MHIYRQILSSIVAIAGFCAVSAWAGPSYDSSSTIGGNSIAGGDSSTNDGGNARDSEKGPADDTEIRAPSRLSNPYVQNQVGASSCAAGVSGRRCEGDVPAQAPSQPNYEAQNTTPSVTTDVTNTDSSDTPTTTINVTPGWGSINVNN